MRRLLVPALLLTVAALLPTAALAKGASKATITGFGLAEPIILTGEGQAGAERLMEIAAQSGFYTAVFEQTPDPMFASRPGGDLGPAYRVEYAMPGPNNEQDTIVQQLYPYTAFGPPVTYVEPGQSFWTTEKTKGGWFVASAALTDLLVGAGLPESAPTVGTTPSGLPWSVVGPIAALAAVGAAAAIGAALLMRRRPQAA